MTGPICLVLVCRVDLISSVVLSPLLHVIGHHGRVMCPFFQSMFGLCSHSHVSLMMALSLLMFVTVNGICSVCSPIVSFSDAYLLTVLALLSVPSTLKRGFSDGRSCVHM